MNYWTILIFTLMSVSFSHAEGRKRIPNYYLTSSEIDSSLEVEQAVYAFNFHDVYEEGFQKNNAIPIRYSLDGEDRTEPLIDGNQLTVTSSPGKHIFQFYFTADYYEIYTDSLNIKSQHRDHYSVYFRISHQEEEAEKPVIYLYPTDPMAVEFKINIKGEQPFLYPKYEDGWRFTAQPNGELEFGEEAYNYLFWEASDVVALPSKDFNTGFIAAGSTIVSFLEEKLTEAGLTSKEQADFITYWAPRMQGNDYNFVHFVFNEECDRYATFEIDPQPDNIYRIYMVWAEVAVNFTTLPQEIKSINRQGFTVLEWGGQETSIKPIVCKLPTNDTKQL